MLIAYGATEEADALVGVDLDDQGRLVITIDTGDREDVFTLPGAAVVPDVRALVREEEAA